MPTHKTKRNELKRIQSNANAWATNRWLSKIKSQPKTREKKHSLANEMEKNVQSEMVFRSSVQASSMMRKNISAKLKVQPTAERRWKKEGKVRNKKWKSLTPFLYWKWGFIFQSSISVITEQRMKEMLKK